MSSEEVEHARPPLPVKKRRSQRACDSCRQSRSDGLKMPGRKCTDCIEARRNCTYSGAVYIETLEARLSQTEKLLREVCHYFLDATRKLTPKFAPPQATAAGSQGPGVELATLSIRNLNESEPMRVDATSMELKNFIQTLDAKSAYVSRFHGESSGAHLVKATAELREEYAADTGMQSRAPWTSRRMQYWTSLPPAFQSQRDEAMVKPYTYPPPDVLSSLIWLYFEHCNIYVPLLHRPTFERAVAGNLHLRDDKFAATVLLVCALGSRFSDDPRVYDPAAPLTCGWKYFSQVSATATMHHFFRPPMLYDLQYYALASQFLECCVPHAHWSLTGLGIRIAQEAGVHQLQSKPPTIESELWNRAFWALVLYDRISGSGLGRPCALQYEDIDIELPTECDDGYWESESPALPFQQPPGTPSRVSFYVALLRLSNILAFSLRVVYSSRKSKDLLAVRDDAWEERLVAELDSALNKWLDSLPEHLRWDPSIADPVFFKQSAALYCSYYYVQMMTHRAFIPMIRKTAPTSLPSLAICTNAARSCSRIAEIVLKRLGPTPAVILLPAVKTASFVLLVIGWSGKRTGLPLHMNTAITEVHRCMEVIRICEDRWQDAGLVWDILNEFVNVGDSRVQPAVPTGAKRTEGAQEGSNGQPSTQFHELPTHTSSAVCTVTAYTPSFDDPPLAWAEDTERHWTHALPMHPLYSQVDLSSGTGEAEYRDAATWAEPSHMSSAPHLLNLNLNPMAGPSQLGAANEADPLMGSILESDVLAMWANAPATFGCVASD
ncbi:fungal-specific transcription factor domain-containing protein [Mycena galericulata]|nr:fungal-specific transcription factor domain-containing protein [Mycena galericulata]